MCQTVCSHSNDKTPANSPGSLSYEGAMGRASPNTNFFSPTISSAGTQHEAVRLSGQCTIQLIESLVDMVSKLTEDAAHRKNDMSLSQETENLSSLIEAPCPGPFLSSLLRGNAPWLQRSPTRKRQYSACAFSRDSRPGIACCFYTCRDVATAGLSSTGLSALPDSADFKTITYKKRPLIVLLARLNFVV